MAQTADVRSIFLFLVPLFFCCADGVCVLCQVSNLNRQFLFREHNVGQAKSSAAAVAAKAMNSAIKVLTCCVVRAHLANVMRCDGVQGS